MDTIIGRCSLCTGNVIVPEAWYGITIPALKPTCTQCGAQAQEQVPLIMMEQPRKATWGQCLRQKQKDLMHAK